MAHKKPGVLLSTILNGYTKQQENDHNQNLANEIPIDPELIEESEDLSFPFSSVSEDEIPIEHLKSGQATKKRPINLMNVLSGYSKKPREKANNKEIKDTKLIIVDESPSKTACSEEIQIIKENLPSARTSNIASFLNMDRKPIQRANIVSKEMDIPAPLPSTQMTPRYKNFAFTAVPLRKRKVEEAIHDFEPYEYASLNQKHSNKKITKTICVKEDTTNTALWNDLFKPEDCRDVLVDSDTISNIWNWFSNAFEKLKKKTDRSALYNRKDFDAIDSFVVEDGTFSSDADDEVTEFVPLLILYGGVGKNTLLEAIMAQHDAQIFEINCSMNRAKKDISETLNEFATTKYVKDTQSRGIILFDDVDVLLTETDKFFWNSVHSTLMVTKRPVVITCRDYRHIPSNLLEIAERYNSIFKIDNPPRERLKKYLQNCLDRKGVQVDDSVLNFVLDSYPQDIRKCIVELQWICTKPATWTYMANEKYYEPTELDKKITQTELLSCYDIITTTIAGKSVVLEDMDPTLNYTGHHMQTERETEEIKNILWNYTEHIWDSNYNPLLPWEINVKNFAKYFKHFNGFEDHFCNPTDLKFKKSLTTMLKFLMTRVSMNRSEGIIKRPTSTRSARRKKTTLNDYRLKADAHSQSNVDVSEDELLQEFLSTHRFLDTVVYLLPAVFQIAKNEQNIKSKNLALYSEIKKTHGPDSSSNEIINEMIQRKLLLPAFFRGASEPFIDSYK